MITHYILRIHNSLMLLADQTHFLGKDGWSFFMGGYEHSVILLLDPKFIPPENDMFEAVPYVERLAKDEALIAKGIGLGLVIVAANIKNVSDFKGKIIVGKQKDGKRIVDSRSVVLEIINLL